MAATTSFQNGTITFEQAANVVAGMGAIVGRLAAAGRTDSVKNSPEVQVILEGIVAMVNTLATGTDGDFEALIAVYNTHGILNYVGAQVGAEPGMDTDLLVKKAGEIGN